MKKFYAHWMKVSIMSTVVVVKRNMRLLTRLSESVNRSRVEAARIMEIAHSPTINTCYLPSLQENNTTRYNLYFYLFEPLTTQTNQRAEQNQLNRMESQRRNSAMASTISPGTDRAWIPTRSLQIDCSSNVSPASPLLQHAR
jgi:hypothetical protein